MGFHFSCCSRIILCIFLVLLFVTGFNSRRINQSELEKESSDGNMGHMTEEMDPSLHVFFTINDLKIGKNIPIYFPNKNNSNSPHLLSRQETNSIPFSSKQIPYLLELFSFSKDSPQAKGMEYTLTQCETEPIEGETKSCVTSLESMLDFVRITFGLDTQFKALTTNYVKKPAKELLNYTILKNPKEITAKRMISCHIMPYPFVVYYCHSREGGNKAYEILLSGENGEKIEAAAICHMDTSQWETNHVSFRVLKLIPGSSPVCHFLPADNVVWVPLSAN